MGMHVVFKKKIFKNLSKLNIKLSRLKNSKLSLSATSFSGHQFFSRMLFLFELVVPAVVLLQLGFQTENSVVEGHLGEDVELAWLHNAASKS